jgi:hypothetical protein
MKWLAALLVLAGARANLTINIGANGSFDGATVGVQPQQLELLSFRAPCS